MRLFARQVCLPSYDELLFLGENRSTFTIFANGRSKIQTKAFLTVGDVDGMGIAILKGHREE
jgi:hypothetical protein